MDVESGLDLFATCGPVYHSARHYCFSSFLSIMPLTMEEWRLREVSQSIYTHASMLLSSQCLLLTRSGMDTSQGDVVSLAITEVQMVFHVNRVELAEEAYSLATRLKCSSEMCDDDKLFWTKDSKSSYIVPKLFLIRT